MLGCCGAESTKFIDKDHKVDQERFKVLSEKKKSQGWTDSNVEHLMQCACPCHQDGMVVMC